MELETKERNDNGVGGLVSSPEAESNDDIAKIVDNSGRFNINSPVWYPKKVWPKGSYIPKIGHMKIAGPFARIALTTETGKDYMTCLFCFHKNLLDCELEAASAADSGKAPDESASPRCSNCSRLLLRRCFWMIDFAKRRLRLGDPVKFKLKKTMEQFVGFITSVVLSQGQEKISIHGFAHNMSAPEAAVDVVEVTLKQEDMNSRMVNLEKMDVLSSELGPLLSRGLCGACGMVYELGSGHLLAREGKKIENAQYSYFKLSEKINVAISQRNIFISKKQNTNILTAQENINHMHMKRNELEPQLASVCVGCAHCGWTPFKAINNGKGDSADK
jgi:hypothetical protein